MAYAMTKQGSLDNVITYEFICDTLTDMNAIENTYRTLGSVAIVLSGESEGLEVYIAGSNRQWNSLGAMSGGSSSAAAGLVIHVCSQNEYDANTLLPTVQTPDETTLYLVPASAESGNLYDEYIYVDEAWEKFGSANIDLSNYIQKTDIATQSTAGLVKVLDNGNVTFNENNQLVLTLAGTAVVKTGQSDHPISVTHQHEAAFYGLAKAAGQDMKNSGNAVGTYTTEAASAIRTMIGAGTYSKPAGGIPAADLAETYLTAHQDINGKANVADPVFTGTLSQNRQVGTTVGANSTALGYSCTASGAKSVAEGDTTRATGMAAHAEGVVTTAAGEGSHAEGFSGSISRTINNVTYTVGAHGAYAHAEGASTSAFGTSSHAEGQETVAGHTGSHAEGTNTAALNTGAHAEGTNTTASGIDAHAEGVNTQASGYFSHAEGVGGIAAGVSSHIEGTQTGSFTVANNNFTPTAAGEGSHAEGIRTYTYGQASHAEGTQNAVVVNYAHAEGQSNFVSGVAAHAEGYNNNASGTYSHVEGRDNRVSSEAAHVEGKNNGAYEKYAHVEGCNNLGTGEASHTEGYASQTQGKAAHAEGYSTIASRAYAHAGGMFNAGDNFQFLSAWAANTAYQVGDKVRIEGEYGPEGYICVTANNDAVFTAAKWTQIWGLEPVSLAEMIGNGTDGSHRSNARALDWSGNEYLKGDIYINCNADSTGGTALGALLSAYESRIAALEAELASLRLALQAQAIETEVVLENGEPLTDENGNLLEYDLPTT